METNMESMISTVAHINPGKCVGWYCFGKELSVCVDFSESNLNEVGVGKEGDMMV